MGCDRLRKMRGNDFLECSSNFVPAAMRRLYLTFSNLYPHLLLLLLQLLNLVLLLCCCSCSFPGQILYPTGTDAVFSEIGLFLWRCCSLCVSPHLPGVGCSLGALWWCAEGSPLPIFLTALTWYCRTWKWMSNINRMIPWGKPLKFFLRPSRGVLFVGFGWEFSGKMGFSLEGVSSSKLKQLIGIIKCQ